MELEEPRKEYMTYCGQYQMRSASSDTKAGEDGINGTVVVPKSKAKAAGVSPGDDVFVLVEANGKTTTAERAFHKSGNTLTLPLEKRQELSLSPGDEIEFWIDSVRDDSAKSEDVTTKDEERVQATIDSEAVEHAEEYFAVIGNSLTYHLLDSEDADETVCGVSLEDKDYRGGEDPGNILDACHDCKVCSSKPMTNEEIVDWLSVEAEFEQAGGPPSYFNKEQLAAIRDRILELKDKAE